MASSTETNPTPTGSSTVNDPHTYYNNTEEQGLRRRNESKIYYMRNFNNWIKSTLINEYLQRIRKEQRERANEINVFDMGCGKGGDQLKWKNGGVKSVTFADLAEKSVNDCEQRYREGRFHYKAKFFSLNCTTELLGDKLGETEPCFDLVSTQFVLHYAFDKYQSVDRFLRNAAEFLRVGGYFVGTTVNAARLIQLCRQSPNQSISNDVFEIRFDSSIALSSTDDNAIPLFGVKYHFILDEVVDCPEYLVHFPLLVELAKRHGLELVERLTFRDYFHQQYPKDKDCSLLAKIKALELFSTSSNNADRQGSNAQYQHAVDHLNKGNDGQGEPKTRCRTLSKQEWEMTSLYITFAFQKKHEVIYENN